MTDEAQATDLADAGQGGANLTQCVTGGVEH